MMFKKLFFLLTVLFLLLLLSGTASAIPINDEDDFLKIGLNQASLGGTYELGKDLDFTNKTFVPIGSGTYPFTGIFDGQGHEIKGIDYSFNTGGNQGIFRSLQDSQITNLIINSSNISTSGTHNSIGILAGQVNNSTIDNVTLMNCSVGTSGNNVGILAGQINGSMISNITVEIDGGSTICIVKGKGYVGGLAGLVNNSTIKDVYVNSGLLTATENNLGGLVGDLINSTVESSYYIGSMTSDRDNVGGLVGRVENSTIFQCFSISDIRGRAAIGGFVGVIRDDSGTGRTSIENSFAEGTIAGTSYVGSFVGRVNQNVKLNIVSSYAFCSDVSPPQFNLPFIAFVQSGVLVTVDDSFGLYDTLLGPFAYGIPISETQFKNIDTFMLAGTLVTTDWDITESLSSNSIWYTDGVLPPQLRFVAVDSSGGNNSGNNSGNNRGNNSGSSIHGGNNGGSRFGHAYVIQPTPLIPSSNSPSGPEIVPNIQNSSQESDILSPQNNNPSDQESNFSRKLVLLLLIGIVIAVGAVFYIWNKNRRLK